MLGVSSVVFMHVGWDWGEWWDTPFLHQLQAYWWNRAMKSTHVIVCWWWPPVNFISLGSSSLLSPVCMRTLYCWAPAGPCCLSQHYHPDVACKPCRQALCATPGLHLPHLDLELGHSACWPWQRMPRMQWRALSEWLCAHQMQFLQGCWPVLNAARALDGFVIWPACVTA